MIGAATTPYAEELKQRLRDGCRAAVVEQRFLGPSELAAVCCLLGIHGDALP